MDRCASLLPGAGGDFRGRGQGIAIMSSARVELRQMLRVLAAPRHRQLTLIIVDRLVAGGQPVGWMIDHRTRSLYITRALIEANISACGFHDPDDSGSFDSLGAP